MEADELEEYKAEVMEGVTALIRKREADDTVALRDLLKQLQASLEHDCSIKTMGASEYDIHNGVVIRRSNAQASKRSVELQSLLAGVESKIMKFNNAQYELPEFYAYMFEEMSDLTSEEGKEIKEELIRRAYAFVIRKAANG